MATAIMPPELIQHEENVFCVPLCELVLEPASATPPRKGRYVQNTSILKTLIKAFSIEYQQDVTNVMWNRFKSLHKAEYIQGAVFPHKHGPLGLFLHEDIARDYAAWFAICCRKRANQAKDEAPRQVKVPRSKKLSTPASTTASAAAAPALAPAVMSEDPEPLSKLEIELLEKLDKYLRRFEVFRRASANTTLPASGIAASLTSLLSQYDSDTVSAVMRSNGGKRVQSTIEELCPGAYAQVDWPRLLFGVVPINVDLVVFS
jgi:hypothetical protein